MIDDDPSQNKQTAKTKKATAQIDLTNSLAFCLNASGLTNVVKDFREKLLIFLQEYFFSCALL